jgi:S1-C subfamily serine protease
MLRRVLSFFKAIPNFVYSCLKGIAMFLGCVYLFLGILNSIPDVPVQISTNQVEKNLPKLIPSSSISEQRSIVRLYVGEQFYCSGVVIGDNYVLTASHCLIDEYGKMRDKPIIVENDDGSVRVVAKPVGANLRMDWGLLKGNFSKIPGAHLVSRDLLIEPKVAACGYPFGSHPLYCATVYPLVNDLFMVKCGGVVFPGMSGGPVFDQAGEVIGLNIQGYEAKDGGGSAYTPTLGILAAFGIGD